MMKLQRAVSSAAVAMAAVMSFAVFTGARPVPHRAPAASAAPIYKDASASIAARVEDLLKRMTLDEKVAQIGTIWQNKDGILGPDGTFDPAKASAAFPSGVGQIARPSDLEGTTRTGRGRDTRVGAGAAGAGGAGGAHRATQCVTSHTHIDICITAAGILAEWT